VLLVPSWGFTSEPALCRTRSKEECMHRHCCCVLRFLTSPWLTTNQVRTRKFARWLPLRNWWRQVALRAVFPRHSYLIGSVCGWMDRRKKMYSHIHCCICTQCPSCTLLGSDVSCRFAIELCPVAVWFGSRSHNLRGIPQNIPFKTIFTSARFSECLLSRLKYSILFSP